SGTRVFTSGLLLRLAPPPARPAWRAPAPPRDNPQPGPPDGARWRAGPRCFQSSDTVAPQAAARAFCVSRPPPDFLGDQQQVLFNLGKHLGGQCRGGTDRGQDVGEIVGASDAVGGSG